MKLIVTFHMLDAAGDEDKLDMVQFYDVPALPATGEPCRIVTSRDGNGNYSLDGRPQRRWDGVVLRREFSYEVRGRCPGEGRPVVFVDVYLEATEQ